MKKLTTIIAAIAVGVGTLFAAPVNPGVRNDLRIVGVKDSFRQKQSQIESGKILSSENTETRAWISGTSQYEARFQLMSERLCDMLKFDDGNGNAVNPTFDQLPYYCVCLTLSRMKVGAESANMRMKFYLAWPTEYIFNQVFDYKGVLDENRQIPIDQRNYDVVPIDELFNASDRCRRFQESVSAGAAGEPADGRWEYYTILPNSIIGNQGVFVTDGEYEFVYSVVTESIASYFEMRSFDEEEDIAQFYGRIYYSEDGTDASVRQVQLGREQSPFDGLVDVQGWTYKVIDMPDFGDLYIFNTGLISGESFGDANPFPLDFPELTGLYFTISDKYIAWQVDAPGTGAVPFDRDKFVQTGAVLPEGQALIDHANMVQGYFFADPKYAKDINLDLEPTDFVCQPVTMVEQDEDTYWAECAPAIDSMIPYGVSDMYGNSEPWSQDYGACFMYQNWPELCWDPSFIGWGYPQGIIVNMQNETLTSYYATSKGKIYYYYNPKNMKEVRELTPFGNRDGVEEVTVEGIGAKIFGGDGVITVRVDKVADVAVYGLDGVCLKGAKAVPGEDLNVEAGHGIYVVKVGEKAVKVAL